MTDMGSILVADGAFDACLKSFRSLRLGGTQPFQGQGTALVVHVTFESPVLGVFVEFSPRATMLLRS